MKLSIIIPLYNVQDYVFRAAKSIAHQAFDGLEIILVDDGSYDNSLDTCMSYLEGLEVVAVRQKNAGPGGARNTGIINASGEYIMFLDGDDFLLPNAFDRILTMLNKDAPDVLFGRYHLWTEKKGLTSAKKVNTPPPDDPKSRTEYILCNQPEAAWCPIRYICKREFLLEHLIFFETDVLCEDVKWSLDLLMAVENNNGKISFLPEPFYAYFYRRPGSTMTTHSVKRLVDLNNVVLRLLEVYKERPLIYRVLVSESFFYVNEYCLFARADRKRIHEAYRNVLPAYHRSGFFVHRIAGKLQNKFMFYLMSVGLYSIKMLRRGVIHLRWRLKGSPRMEVPSHNNIIVEISHVETQPTNHKVGV